MHGGLFHVLGDSGDIGCLVLEIGVHADLVDNGAIDGLDAWLIVGQGNLVKRLHRIDRLFQADFSGHRKRIVHASS